MAPFVFRDRQLGLIVKLIATGKINQAAAKYGDHAPMAAVCCNACRACIQTNAIAVVLAVTIAAGAGVVRAAKRFTATSSCGTSPNGSTSAHPSASHQ
jgi:hypothetical protein